jgi:hypothetical protein
LTPASADVSLGLFFDPEDGGDTFLWNIDFSELRDVVTHIICHRIYFGTM